MEKSIKISVGVDTSPVLKGLEALKRDMGSMGAAVGADFTTALQAGIGGASASIDDKAGAMIIASKDRVVEVQEAMREGVDSTLGHLTTAFSEFARTGELNVRQMVGAILADLARLAAQTFLEDTGTSLLKSVASFGANLFSAGASGGAKMPVPKMKALGGPVGFGKPYVVGEQGRELFVPDTSGHIVPNGAATGGIGGGNITFNVQATDAQSFQRSEGQISAMLNRMVRRGNRNL